MRQEEKKGGAGGRKRWGRRKGKVGQGEVKGETGEIQGLDRRKRKVGQLVSMVGLMAEQEGAG